MASSNFIDASNDAPGEREYRYLKPSVFWSIRQGFPRRLSALIISMSLAVPLILWAIASYAGWVPSMFLPTPSDVMQSGIEMFTQDDLLTDVLVSCGRVLAGFLVAAFIGVPM
jgi:NitT/TauT family transport system permease protein